MKKVSLKDIAKKAKVSTATVSYVLGNKKCRVSETTKERIRAIAQELNYQPNQIAQSLKSGKTYTIGLIVADISNPFFANIARVIEDEAAKFGYTVIFGSSDESAEKSWKLIQFLKNRQVDGFIIVPTENSEGQIEYLQEQKIPFVLLDRYFPKLNTTNVAINNFEIASEMVKDLIKTSPKRIGMIAYKNSLIHMEDRIRGFEEASKSIESFIKRVGFNTMETDVELALENLLQNKVEALFFATNSLAVAGLRVLQQKHIKIPKEIAIASFDESEAFEFFYSPVSYIQQPIIKMGTRALQLLLNKVNTPELQEKTEILTAECVFRKSSQS